MDDLASSESLTTFYWLPKCSDNFLRGGGVTTLRIFIYAMIAEKKASYYT